MKNYISVNAKHYKKGEINRISKHNFRLQKISYLLPKKHIKYENVNIIYANNIINKYTQPYENDLTKLGEYSKNLSKFYDKKGLDDILQSQYNLLLRNKEKIQYKNKSYAKSNESTLVEMVVALSEEQAKFYLENGQDLGKGFDNFTKNLCEKYGFTPLQVSLHLDEGHVRNGVEKLNVHAHITLFNYDFEKERSVLRTLKKKDYRDMQDMASQSFQEVGFNFIRGIDKEISGREHLEQNDFILEKQTQEINQNNSILEKQTQQIENYDLILKSLIPDVTREKKDLKALLNTFDKNSVEYKLVYNLVGSTMTLDRELRKYAKIEDFNKETKNEIINLLNKHLEKVKTISGKKFYKLENSNANALVRSLEEFAQKLSNVDLEFTQNQENAKKIEELEKVNQTLAEQNSILKKKLSEEVQKNNNLTQTTKGVIEQSDKLIEAMEKQESTIKRGLARDTRLRNQRNKLLQKVMKDNNLKSVMQTRGFLRNNKTRDRALSRRQVDEGLYDLSL